MIMTDQDHDGSHIKGLIMNFFHHFYPSLLRLPSFLVEFITPIIKVGYQFHITASHLLARLGWARNQPMVSQYISSCLDRMSC